MNRLIEQLHEITDTNCQFSDNGFGQLNLSKRWSLSISNFALGSKSTHFTSLYGTLNSSKVFRQKNYS